jgi:hypothetical protein
MGMALTERNLLAGAASVAAGDQCIYYLWIKESL